MKLARTALTLLLSIKRLLELFALGILLSFLHRFLGFFTEFIKVVFNLLRSIALSSFPPSKPARISPEITPHNFPAEPVPESMWFRLTNNEPLEVVRTRADIQERMPASFDGWHDYTGPKERFLPAGGCLCLGRVLTSRSLAFADDQVREFFEVRVVLSTTF